MVMGDEWVVKKFEASWLRFVDSDKFEAFLRERGEYELLVRWRSLRSGSYKLRDRVKRP